MNAYYDRLNAALSALGPPWRLVTPVYLDTGADGSVADGAAPNDTESRDTATSAVPFHRGEIGTRARSCGQAVRRAAGRPRIRGGGRRGGWVLAVLLLVGTFASSCASAFGGRSEPCGDAVTERFVAPASTAGPAVAGLAAGGSWGYQLQQVSPAVVAASNHDLVVVDYSADGSAAGAFSEADVEEMRSGGALVVAYSSIGEAEDYRGYFDADWVRWRPRGAPCWLGQTNRDWPGNYKVQYWSAGWQGIVLTYLDRIIDAGFDGVYLDIVDAYSYWSDEGNREGFSLPASETARHMINLVARIARHARVDRGRPGFLVIPQNAEEIADYDDGRYLAAIDAIGIEDLFYDEINPVPGDESEFRLRYLRRLRDAGKAVLVVDYVGSDPRRVSDFRTAVLGEGFVPYAADPDRELDELLP